MKEINGVILISLCFLNTVVKLRAFENGCFRAAVYEHIPIGNITRDNPKDIINMNLNVYEKVAKEASSRGANIIVYPEDGIIDPNGCKRTKAQEFIEQIPEPRNGTHNPCDEPQQYKTRQTLYRLSCMAKNNNMYIVADMGDYVPCNKSTDPNCPSDNHYQFNTAVAFDPKGNLIAKYHKIQLFYEYYYNVPSKPDFVYFDTPFGRMGLQICMDINYFLPGIKLIEDYNVTTILFPTWWFDGFPFQYASLLQQSWAITNRVNLLAANVHVPKQGSLGSGIYSGNYGAIIYTDDPNGQSKLLIADIPIDSRSESASKCFKMSKPMNIPLEKSKEIEKYHYDNMSMKGFVLWRLMNKNDTFRTCENGLCCELNYEVADEKTLKSEPYFFAISNQTGNAITEHYPICEEICSVIRCDGTNSTDVCTSFPMSTKSTVFTQLHLNGKFSTKYTYPSVSTNNLHLVDRNKWDYVNNGITPKEVHLQLNGFNEPILTAGLYGRCYNRDPPYKQ